MEMAVVNEVSALRLARNQILMGHGETLKEAAAKHNPPPIEILKVILMDRYKLN
jgi:hypothetical protein